MSIIKGTNQVVAGFGGTKENIGDVKWSYSKLATDNSGRLPLFTGETIASANTIYPEFYNWILAHTELQCTTEEYESALTTYGECAKYATKSQTTSYEWNGATSSMTVSGVYTKSDTPTIGDIIYNDEACSTPSVGSDGVTRTVLTIVSTDPYTFTADFGFQDEQGNPRFTLVTSHNVTITDGSLRLPLIKNYIKAANPSEGIKNIEAGLPNITGELNAYGFNNGWYKATGPFASNGDPLPRSDFQNGNGVGLSFDASRSSAIYGKSSTVTPASTTLYPWVVAYTAAVPASTAQAAEFQNALSGKLDLPSGKTQADVDFVVESYHGEDGNWYRKYKSGWVEQGGYGKGNITFLKPYSSLPNVITGSANKTGDGWPARANEVTATGFYLYGGNQDTVSAYWEAKGQGGENV